MTSGTASDAAGFCADLVRSHDFPRYASTLFVAPAERRALLSLFAFNVEISRVHSLVSQPLAGEIRLQWWTDMLAGAEDGGAEGNPVGAELLRTVRAHDLPLDLLSRLIEEHRFDLYNDPMPSMTALEGYLGGTSSALFALAARVMASPSGEIEHLAQHAGLAQGIAHVLAMLPRDASRQQLYVPVELLQQHGGNAEEVFSGRSTVGTRAAVDQLVRVGQEQLTTAMALLASVPAQVRPVFLPLALVRRELQQMARTGGDPFAPNAPSRLRDLWTLWRASRSRDFG